MDYIDDETKDFYYRGEVQGATVSTTSADQVVDCVQNNLQFEEENEKNTENKWAYIETDALIDQNNSNWLVNGRLKDELNEFNTIIQTSNTKKELVPYDGNNEDESTQINTLILSQLITPENTDDDLTYTNMLEIVKTSNNAGRRMAYSVVGNQDPSYDDASEIDASTAERVIILPPFGERAVYYIVGAIVGILLIAGIVLIIRKVLKKTN